MRERLLADFAEHRESVQKPVAHAADRAGEKRDAGEHKQTTHRFFNQAEMRAKSGKKSGEGFYRWNEPEPAQKAYTT